MLQDETTMDTEEHDQCSINEFHVSSETWTEAAEISEDDSVEDPQGGSPEITLSFVGNEIQVENETQEDEGHTPVLDDDYRTLWPRQWTSRTPAEKVRWRSWWMPKMEPRKRNLSGWNGTRCDRRRQGSGVTIGRRGSRHGLGISKFLLSFIPGWCSKRNIRSRRQAG